MEKQDDTISWPRSRALVILVWRKYLVSIIVIQLAVTVVLVYLRPLVAARHDAVSEPSKFDAYLACHRPESWTQLASL